MIKRRLGFAGILLAGLILALYLTGGGKIFGRLGVSRCEKLWKEWFIRKPEKKKN